MRYSRFGRAADDRVAARELARQRLIEGERRRRPRLDEPLLQLAREDLLRRLRDA